MSEAILQTHKRPSFARAAEASPSGIDVSIPIHPLARRARGWTLWLILLALLIWSWGPAEMFRAASLISDWRNMAEFGRAFLHPNFRDWETYLADMVVTVQIAIWGTALHHLRSCPHRISARNGSCSRFGA